MYLTSLRDEFANHKENREIAKAGTQIFGCFRFLSKVTNASVKQLVPIRVQLEVLTDPIKNVVTGVATANQANNKSEFSFRKNVLAATIKTAAKKELNNLILTTLDSTSGPTKILSDSMYLESTADSKNFRA
jgi:hypothetical protein